MACEFRPEFGSGAYNVKVTFGSLATAVQGASPCQEIDSAEGFTGFDRSNPQHYFDPAMLILILAVFILIRDYRSIVCVLDVTRLRRRSRSSSTASAASTSTPMTISAIAQAGIPLTGTTE
jgi:hypothetical protein